METFFDLLNVENPPVEMKSDEFREKTKTLLDEISKSYNSAWVSRPITDEEVPEENCDDCCGCGIFKDENGVERECVQDWEAGECIYRFVDYEQFGMDVESKFNDLFELYSVDKLI